MKIEVANTHLSIADWFDDIYQLQKKAEKSSFSLRAFAKRTGMSAATLSQVMSKKRKFTSKMALRVSKQMGMSGIKREQFLALAAKEYIRNRYEEYTGQNPITESTPPFKKLRSHALDAVSDWPYYAILSLVETETFAADPIKIASRLGLTVKEVRKVWTELNRLELIHLSGKKWVATQRCTTTQDIPSKSLRRLHQGQIEQALKSLHQTPLDKRDISFITMAINPDQLPVAKEYIRQFRRGLSQILETGRRREVYNLNIQLFPLSGKEQQ